MVIIYLSMQREQDKQQGRILITITGMVIYIT